MPDFADATSSELERKARALQWVCVAEALTYSLLLYFMITGNDLGRALLGSLHGVIVLAFAAMVIMITRAMRWSWWYVVLVLLTGPIGAILVYERIRRHGVPEEFRIKTASPSPETYGAAR
ncbi:MAG: DUF3817 domain-containing protein [Acidimicrobiia bacterium]